MARSRAAPKRLGRMASIAASILETGRVMASIARACSAAISMGMRIKM